MSDHSTIVVLLIWAFVTAIDRVSHRRELGKRLKALEQPNKKSEK